MPNSNRIVLFILFAVHISLPMNAPHNDNLHDSFNIEASHQCEISTHEQGIFNNIEIEEMILVFASSPQAAQCIINHLQDPTYFPNSKSYRSAIFVGEPGSGKTTTAMAIAYKMAQEGWEYKFISSMSLLGEHRNQTAILLQKELAAIEKSGKPTILIIDELNRLLENSDSKHHDTDSTSTVLWTFLDRQNGNGKFFLIGTMNRVDKLPKPYKDRILFDFIEFPPITDSPLKTEIIRKNLNTQNIFIDAEVTDDFLKKELEKLGPCSGRSLQKLSIEIGKIGRMNQQQKSSVIIVKKAFITQAINEHINRKISIKYDALQETDEERQNRYHRENQAAQERHFIQQQLIQMTIQNNQQVDTSNSNIHYHYISAKGFAEISDLISDEQKQAYAHTMKNTHLRKAEEAKEAQRIADIEIAAQEEAAKKAAEDAKLWFWDRK